MKFFFLLLLVHPLQLFSQIQLLNDEFDDPGSLSANWLNINDVEQWNAEHLELFGIDTIVPSHLHMMPQTGTWYQNYRSNLLFKNLSGDFVMTTEVSSTNRALDDIPGLQFSLAGLMIRTERDYPNGALNDWTAGAENYIFMACGNANGGSGPHFEVKNTINSNSSLSITPINTSTNVQIRIARISEFIIVLFKLPSDTNWTVHRRYTRTDFPNDIQMGFVTYTDWQKVNTYDPFFHNSHELNDQLVNDPSSNPGLDFSPDIVADFAFARFDSVYLPANLIGVDLDNDATDAELLGFLGYDSEHYCPDYFTIVEDIQQDQLIENHAAIALQINSNIQENAKLSLHAENHIILDNGFTMELGATLTASILNCP